MKGCAALVLTVLIFVLSLASANAAPTNVFTLDDALKIKVSGCDEAELCSDYTFTVTVEALRNVTVKKLKVTVYCKVSCCEQKVYEATLLSDYYLSVCCKKSWTITVECCTSVPEDPWIRVKIWASYNFTNDREDNATLLFNLAPARRVTYCDLYNAYWNLKEDYEQLSSEYEDLKEKYGKLLDQYSELTTQYSQLLSQKVSLETELKEKEEALAKLEAELNSTRKELERVRAALEDTMRELAEKENALRKLDADYKTLASDFNACEAKYLSLVREHEKLMSDYESTWNELTVFRAVVVALLVALAAIIVTRYVLPTSLTRSS